MLTLLLLASLCYAEVDEWYYAVIIKETVDVYYTIDRCFKANGYYIQRTKKSDHKFVYGQYTDNECKNLKPGTELQEVVFDKIDDGSSLIDDQYRVKIYLEDYDYREYKVDAYKTMNCAEDVTHPYKYITFRWENPLIRYDVGDDLTVCGKTDLEHYMSTGTISERQVWIYTKPNECNSSVARLIITFIAILIFLI